MLLLLPRLLQHRHPKHNLHKPLVACRAKRFSPTNTSSICSKRAVRESTDCNSNLKPALLLRKLGQVRLLQHSFRLVHSR